MTNSPPLRSVPFALIYLAWLMFGLTGVCVGGEKTTLDSLKMEFESKLAAAEESHLAKQKELTPQSDPALALKLESDHKLRILNIRVGYVRDLQALKAELIRDGDTEGAKLIRKEITRSSGGDARKVELFGIGSVVKRVVFIVDFSGSMSEGSRLSMMKEELDTSLGNLPAKVSYQMIYYSHRPWLGGENVGSAPFRDYEDPEDRLAWLKATEANIKVTKEQLANMGNSGGTNWIPPIHLALAMAPPPDEIWLITDGEANDRKEFVEEMEEINPDGVTINTVAIDIAGPAAKTLIEIADKTGGSFSAIIGKNLHTGEAARKIVRKAK